ncbi:MAG TPA: hypothetical protein VMR97_01810 [Acidimicrobiales bacterium]|nr:hypothetical protein [Acidimicrobiales bacterium]
MSTGIAVQLAVDTFSAAALYALVALAVSLAYSGSGVIHLAIGQVGLAGGLSAASLHAGGMPLLPAVLVGIAVGGALSGVAERALVSPVIGKPMLGAGILLSAALLAQGVLAGIFRQPAYAFPSASGVYGFLGGIVHKYDLLTLATVAVVAGTSAMVIRSRRVGGSLRLTARAPRLAERLGVPTAMVRTSSFVIGGVLATGAILLGAPRFPLVAAGVGALPLRGIAAAAAGRMVSPRRVAGAALLIAAAEVVGGYELTGGRGEFLCDAVALVLVAAGWRR